MIGAVMKSRVAIVVILRSDVWLVLSEIPSRAMILFKNIDLDSC